MTPAKGKLVRTPRGRTTSAELHRARQAACATAMADWSEDGFEELYQSVGGDLEQVPWARLGPNPQLR